MDLETTLKLVTNYGLGTIAFVALLYGGYRLLTWLDEVKSNHLPHIQTALDKLVEGTAQQNAKLDRHGEKLDRIEQNTKGM